MTISYVGTKVKQRDWLAEVVLASNQVKICLQDLFIVTISTSISKCNHNDYHWRPSIASDILVHEWPRHSTE
jgi:hypothetical protein